MILHVIGIGNGKPGFSAAIKELIGRHQLFSGGQRHHTLVKDLLPADHQWITIQSPMASVYDQYKALTQPIVVFASGDPLFYGMANTLQQQFPEAQLLTYPYFNAIQLLIHRTGINSNNLRTVSVHGRSWAALDEALIRQEPLIGVLTDQHKSPSAIAERMLNYGYHNYSLWVGEDLEGNSESVKQLSAAAAIPLKFHPLNCVILQKESQRPVSFGIADSSFTGLEGRPNMITKMPVRLSSLHALDLAAKSVLWDLGFCTGSLSIEAKLHFPHLEVHAFEKREECLDMIRQNQRQHGAPGIDTHMGDMFEFNFHQISRPDAVFIGGHGKRLNELMQRINEFIRPEGTIVLNSVQESSLLEFTNVAQQLNWTLTAPMQLKVDHHNEITILKAIKESE